MVDGVRTISTLSLVIVQGLDLLVQPVMFVLTQLVLLLAASLVVAVNLTASQKETSAPALKAIMANSVSLRSNPVSLPKAVVLMVQATALRPMTVFVKQVIPVQPVAPLIFVLLIKAQTQVAFVLLNSPLESVAVIVLMEVHVYIWTDGKHASAPLAGGVRIVARTSTNVPRTLVRTGRV